MLNQINMFYPRYETIDPQFYQFMSCPSQSIWSPAIKATKISSVTNLYNNIMP